MTETGAPETSFQLREIGGLIQCRYGSWKTRRDDDGGEKGGREEEEEDEDGGESSGEK